MNTKKIKILLVDYDKMMSIYFRDVFWIHGRSDDYDVLIASSLEEADKIIKNKETKPDTIFLDVMMPVEGLKNSPSEQIKRSVSFIEKIKDDKDLSSIKIIIYSSQKEECLKDEISKLKIDGYLVKGDLMPKEIIDFTDKIHESNN
jgi:DNA-binding NarL/FixJ family response regulator